MFSSVVAVTLRVLLYEHVSSGGFSGEPIPPSLLSEGFAMLRGLASDFCASGHSVTALLDARLAALSPPLAADHVVQISSSGEADPTMEKAAEVSDAVLIIAPESNFVLQQMVECIETAGAHSLNSRPVGIEQASDKKLLFDKLSGLGLNFPKTLTFQTNETEEIGQAIKANLGFPAVIKPASGAGCSGISLVANEKEIQQALAKIEKEFSTRVVIQEFLHGVPASVSLVCTGQQALPLSLNLQDVILENPDGISSYNGGLVPLEHPLAIEAFETAKRAVESFGTLRGYVGVDIVLTGEKVFVLEVNPRITTSFVGLRRVSDMNIAESIVDAVLNGKLPQEAHTAGVACFSKVPVSRPIIFAWQEMCNMEELISPPFPLANEDISYGMLQSYGETTDEALQKMREAKAHIHEFWLRGQHPW